MVFFFFTVSIVNNYAMNFNISTPLQMIFRSVSNIFWGVGKGGLKGRGGRVKGRGGKEGRGEVKRDIGGST